MAPPPAKTDAELDAAMDDAPPPPICGDTLVQSRSGDCASEADLRLEMADGARLRTLVFLPRPGNGAATGLHVGPWPALLLRTPYLSTEQYRAFVPFRDHGYAVVVQACRGTGGSDGVVDPLVNEFADGRATVRWLARQAWSSGSVATIGASYEGFTALAAALDAPEVKAVVAGGAIGDAFRGWPLQRGTHRSTGYLWWRAAIDGVELSEDPAFAPAITNHRPLSALDIAFLGAEDPVYRKLIQHSDQDSAYWRARSLIGQLQRLKAPALHFQAGFEWDDEPLRIFLEAQQRAAAPQRFVQTPYGHAGAVYTPLAQSETGKLIRRFLSWHLRREGDPPPVFSGRLWIAGRNVWHESSAWPPHDGHVEYALNAESALSPTAGPAALASYSRAPAVEDPCAVTSNPAAYLYTGPLGAPLDIVGPPELNVRLASSTPDADLFVWLGMALLDGTLTTLHSTRLPLRFPHGYDQPRAWPAGRDALVRVELPAIAQRVAAGNRLVVALYGSECGTAENTNDGLPIATSGAGIPNTTTIYLGGNSGSWLRLPVIR